MDTTTIQALGVKVMHSGELFSQLVTYKSEMQLMLVEKGPHISNYTDEMVSISAAYLGRILQDEIDTTTPQAVIDEHLYCVTMAAATILKEIDIPQYVHSDGMLILANKIWEKIQ